MTATELTARRESLHMPRAQFAAALGVTRSSVYRWEDGSRPIPAMLTLALERLEQLAAV